MCARRLHEQFLGVVSRLRDVAQRHDDTGFAAALEGCVINASGGDPKCPLGELFLEDYGETGVMPRVPDDSRRPRLSLNHFEPPPYDPEHLLQHLHRALAQQAGVHQDQRYVEALGRCAVARQRSDSCPIHRFIAERRASVRPKPT
jgi:hypothetical protein